MTRPDWSPPDIDIHKPSGARIYDYMLGGAHNFAADRQWAERAIAAMPDLVTQARANRAFLYRTVRFLVDVGVRQFLDIGSGIPTSGNVHEVAQRRAPDTSVVYVDVDPVAVTHSRAILTDNDRVVVIQADLRDPDAILAHPDLHTVLDLNQPVGLLLVSILHLIPDADDPVGIVARFRDALAPGSYLAIAHGTADSRPAETARLRELAKQTTTPVTHRSRDQVARLFTGFDLVDPGLVWIPEWRPDTGDNVEHPELSFNYGGVARKP